MAFASISLAHRRRARAAGGSHTAHGVVETPVFMPVGTQGAVKALTHAQLERRWARRSSSATPITCTCGPAMR